MRFEFIDHDLTVGATAIVYGRVYYVISKAPSGKNFIATDKLTNRNVLFIVDKNLTPIVEIPAN